MEGPTDTLPSRCSPPHKPPMQVVVFVGPSCEKVGMPALKAALTVANRSRVSPMRLTAYPCWCTVFTPCGGRYSPLLVFFVSV